MNQTDIHKCVSSFGHVTTFRPFDFKFTISSNQQYICGSEPVTTFRPFDLKFNIDSEDYSRRMKKYTEKHAKTPIRLFWNPHSGEKEYIVSNRYWPQT